MRHTNIIPLLTPGRYPRTNPRRFNITYQVPFYEPEQVIQNPYKESLTAPEYAEPLEFPSVLYRPPQVANPIEPPALGFSPQQYGVAIGEVVPTTLGQPVLPPYREAEVSAIAPQAKVGEIQPAVEQNIHVAEGAIVEAVPCAGPELNNPLIPPNNTPSPQLPFTIDTRHPSGSSDPSGPGGYGVPGGPSGPGNIVPFLGHLFFWLFLLQLFLLLADYSLKKIKKICSDYVEIREKLRELGAPPPNSTDIVPP